MRPGLILHFLFFGVVISCKSKPSVSDHAGFSEKNIELVGLDKDLSDDTLGKITIMVPDRLDTFYKWHNTSDCLSCGRIQYRFADRRYSQFAESGFYWTPVPDSLFQLTIIHNPVRETPDSVKLKKIRHSSGDTSTNYYHQDYRVSTDSVNYLFTHFKIVDERTFIISAFSTPSSFLTHKRSLFVVGATTIRDRDLFLIGECSAADTTDFIDMMYKTILSVKIRDLL